MLSQQTSAMTADTLLDSRNIESMSYTDLLLASSDMNLETAFHLLRTNHAYRFASHEFNPEFALTLAFRERQPTVVWALLYCLGDIEMGYLEARLYQTTMGECTQPKPFPKKLDALDTANVYEIEDFI